MLARVSRALRWIPAWLPGAGVFALGFVEVARGDPMSGSLTMFVGLMMLELRGMLP